MIAFEEAKEELQNQLSEYIEKVGKFQYKNQRWRTADYYKLKQGYAKCEVCGKPNIVNVFIVENVETKQKMTVGNVCINKISNNKISDWYISVKTRLETLEKNKNFIDVTEYILSLEARGELSFFIHPRNAQRLEKMLNRMCKGFDPFDSQRGLLGYYARKLMRYNEKNDE